MVLTEDEFRESVLAPSKRVSERLADILADELRKRDVSEVLLALSVSIMAFGLALESPDKETPELLKSLIDAARELSLGISRMMLEDAREESSGQTIQ